MDSAVKPFVASNIVAKLNAHRPKKYSNGKNAKKYTSQSPNERKNNKWQKTNDQNQEKPNKNRIWEKESRIKVETKSKMKWIALQYVNVSIAHLER